jgi:DNA-binding XRE family transcriptional regulator
MATKAEKEKQALHKECRARRSEWIEFRRKYLFTQKRLAEVLGISRRTVQMIEGERVERPHPDTLRAFLTLKIKHERGETM